MNNKESDQTRFCALKTTPEKGNLIRYFLLYSLSAMTMIDESCYKIINQ